MSEEVGTLEGKVAIVTGAGSRTDGIGTGRAATITLARAGVRVLAVDRDLAAAERTAEMAGPDAAEILPFVADVTDADGCRAMVAAALDRWGQLDILNNNLGVEGPGTVLTDWESWERAITLNVRTAILASAAAIVHLPAGGSIVNTSSIAATRPRGITPYSTTKGAVIALTKSMALDHADQGVRVNCIAPGPIYTPMSAAVMTPELREQRRKASPLHTEGDAWDVARALRFLVSDDARWITGVVLLVDGGVSLQSPAR